VTLRPHKIHIRRVFQARLAGFYSLASQMGGMISIQDALFNELLRLPEGFRYKEELLPSEEESTFERLPFREFEFRGFKGKRRVGRKNEHDHRTDRADLEKINIKSDSHRGAFRRWCLLVAHNSLASGFLSMAALRNKVVSLRWALEHALSCGEKAGE
jgi:hypothetical protein